jgi:deoxyribose-phosphate aldolase
VAPGPQEGRRPGRDRRRRTRAGSLRCPRARWIGRPQPHGLVEAARRRCRRRRSRRRGGVERRSRGRSSRSARASLSTKRSIKKDAKLWALDLAIRMMDLTTLEGKDTEGKVRALCAKGVGRTRPTRRSRSVAAICIYPNMIPTAKRGARRVGREGGQRGDRLPVGPDTARGQAARVAPGGRDAGADEIDMVIDRGAFLPGDYAGLRRDRGGQGGVRRGAPQGHPGDRRARDVRQRRAARAVLAMAAGADFIKTSTGKVQPAATLPVTLVMLEAIRDFHAAHRAGGGHEAGRRHPHGQGGDRYLVVLYETLGPRWMTPDLFRFGASSLLNDVLMQIRKERTGATRAPTTSPSTEPRPVAPRSSTAALRRAFWAESRCISLRHVILEVAGECDAVEVERWPTALDAGARAGRSSTTGPRPRATRCAARRTCSPRTARTRRTPASRMVGATRGPRDHDDRRGRSRDLSTPSSARGGLISRAAAGGVSHSVHLPPFESLIEAHAAELHRFLIAWVGPADAEDCLQETFMSALRAYPRLRQRRAPARLALHDRAAQGDRPGAAPISAGPPRPRRHRAGGGRAPTRDDGLWGTCAALPAKQRTAVIQRFAPRPRLRPDRGADGDQRGGGPPERARRPRRLRREVPSMTDELERRLRAPRPPAFDLDACGRDARPPRGRRGAARRRVRDRTTHRSAA